jgi:hypothetical protein
MHNLPSLRAALGVGVALACAAARAGDDQGMPAQLKALQEQLARQQQRIDALERQLRPPPAAAAGLEQLRGAGAAAPDAPAVSGAPEPVGTATAATSASAAQAPAVAPLFETPGVLTPHRRLVIEPNLQYSYSSSNRVALVGYTVIPALLIGLLDVREVKRSTTTASASFRYGLTNRLELEARVPYVYRSDATVSRELFTGTAAERAFDTTGTHLGDVELGARYQLNAGGPDRPYYIAGLRLKTRTGRDPFEVVTDCQQRCVGANVTGTGLPLTLPTGSGFYSIQSSLTWLLPSDPAVFFGSASYTRNLKRANVYRTVLSGEREPLGEIAAGDVFGFNAGVGLALNDKASLSIGYEHSTVGRTRQNGQLIPGSVRVQLGTLLVGASIRVNPRRSLDVAVGAGLTRDTPDVTLTVRMPFAF